MPPATSSAYAVRMEPASADGGTAGPGSSAPGALRDRLRFRPHRPDARSVARSGLVVVAVLAAATGVVAALESSSLGLTDASPVYFAAIVLVGSILGPWPAIATSVGAFVTYDVLFTEPRLTLVVEDSREWLDLVLFLILAIVVGRLSALGAERAAEASRRAAEATGLFSVGRILATAPDAETAAPLVAERLRAGAGLERVWIVADRGGSPRILADTAPAEPVPTSAFATVLVRMPGDTPARWQRAHEPLPGPPAGHRPGHRPGAAGTTARTPILRVRMEADGVTVGAIRALLAGGTAEPDRSATRLLALAADQLGLALRRDGLRREATQVEITREADALKSALLDAVSHDLRTPLASIRAQAGALTDDDLPLDVAAARLAGAEIDAEAERLDRLVREVLDLSRVESGALRPDLEALDVADAVGPVVDRLRPILGDRPISIAIDDELPPVQADAVLLDGIVANLVENVARHASPAAELRITARVEQDRIELAVDDGGPGVAPDVLRRLFERFHRVSSGREGSRRGLGLGLSIVRGFAEAMGATVRAEPSPLGGLRVVVGLAPAMAPASERTPAAPSGTGGARP